MTRLSLCTIRSHTSGAHPGKTTVDETQYFHVDPDWLTSSPPQAIPIYPPVTQDVGLPIVDMPGCVEAHEEDDGKNEKLVGDDPKGVKIYCDAGMPSYNPIDYTPDSLQYEYVAPVPPVKTPEDAPEVEPPSIPQTNVPSVKIGRP